MITLKHIAGGVAMAGSLTFAALGIGSGLANAAPASDTPQFTGDQGTSQGGGNTPRSAAPSPYAVYGGAGVCATPGLYFVNICV